MPEQTIDEREWVTSGSARREPCIYCGGDSLGVSITRVSGGCLDRVYAITCSECGARGAQAWSIAKALELWNNISAIKKMLKSVIKEYRTGDKGKDLRDQVAEAEDLIGYYILPDSLADEE